MYYMVETLQGCGFGCRRAVKLESDNLRAARKEAKKRQFFQGTILYIGSAVDKIGFMTDAELCFANGKWKRCSRYDMAA